VATDEASTLLSLPERNRREESRKFLEIRSARFFASLRMTCKRHFSATCSENFGCYPSPGSLRSPPSPLERVTEVRGRVRGHFHALRVSQSDMNDC